jgi:hypothetical protein
MHRDELIEATYYTTCLYVTQPKRKNQTMEPVLPLLLGIDIDIDIDSIYSKKEKPNGEKSGRDAHTSCT